MAAMAAAFGAAVTGSGIILPSSPKWRPIDYSLFCGHSSPRFDLSTPFALGEQEFAANYYMLISHDAIHEADTRADRKLPDVSHLPWDKFDCGGWKPWPTTPSYCKKQWYGTWECPTCFGRGRIGENVCKCPECKGDPWDYCGPKSRKPLGDTDDGPWCAVCNNKTGWIGGAQCPQCDGEGDRTGAVMSRIPDHIRVTQSKSIPVRQVMDLDSLGHWDETTETIAVRENQDECQKMIILLHEMIHAAESVLISHGVLGWGYNTFIRHIWGERLVENLAMLLWAWMATSGMLSGVTPEDAEEFMLREHEEWSKQQEQER